MVDQVGDEFYCHCPVGMTGHLHKHTMGLQYDRNKYPKLPTLRPKKLNNRSRKPGRPAKVEPALSKSPVRNLREVDPDYVETGEEQEDLPVLKWTDARLDRSLHLHLEESVIENVSLHLQLEDTVIGMEEAEQEAVP